MSSAEVLQTDITLHVYNEKVHSTCMSVDYLISLLFGKQIEVKSSL